MQPSKGLIIASFFSIYVIWGSTYLFNKIAVSEISPLFLGAIRFSISGILIMIISILMKFSLKITKKQFINLEISGFLFLVFGNGVFAWALIYVDSSFGALMASTQPLFVLFLLRLIDGKKLQKKSIIGVVFGVIGMLLLVTQQEITTSEESLLGVFMMLSCILSWSYGSVFVSKSDLPKNFFVSTGYQMLIASALLFTTSFLFKEEHFSPFQWSSKVQVSVVVLIVFGSIIAFTAFNYLLKTVSPEKVATSAYVNPIIAMFLGWYVLDEQLSLQSIIASLILLLGVYFINSRKEVSKTKVTTKPQKI